jgi:hypothetical protein
MPGAGIVSQPLHVLAKVSDDLADVELRESGLRAPQPG